MFVHRETEREREFFVCDGFVEQQVLGASAKPLRQLWKISRGISREISHSSFIHPFPFHIINVYMYGWLVRFEIMLSIRLYMGVDLKINDSPFCSLKRCEFDNEADASLVSNLLQSGESAKWTSREKPREGANALREAETKTDEREQAGVRAGDGNPHTQSERVSQFCVCEQYRPSYIIHIS